MNFLFFSQEITITLKMFQFVGRKLLEHIILIHLVNKIKKKNTIIFILDDGEVI